MDKLTQVLMEPTPVVLNAMIQEKLDAEIIALAEEMKWSRSRAARYLLWMGVIKHKADKATEATL